MFRAWTYLIYFWTHFSRTLNGKKVDPQNYEVLPEFATICAMCNDSSVDYNSVSAWQLQQGFYCKFTLWPFIETSSWFLLIISTQNHTLRSQEYWKYLPTKEALDCSTNSPCQHLRKCIENGMERMHTDARV